MNKRRKKKLFHLKAATSTKIFLLHKFFKIFLFSFYFQIRKKGRKKKEAKDEGNSININ
jgi:hypothetical protein